MKVSKKPAGAKPKKKGTPDTRRDGRWLWVAVSCGHGKTLHTHENGLKRITFTLLPHRDVAPNRKPRGLTSIKNVITKHIKKKSFLVFDGWKSSSAAATRLGYRFAPPVNHSKAWRDRETGFHSNDVESENSRLKTWLRQRYTKLRLTISQPTYGAEGDESLDLLDLYEFAHYTNVGKSIATIMHSIGVVVDAGRGKPLQL